MVSIHKIKDKLENNIWAYFTPAGEKMRWMIKKRLLAARHGKALPFPDVLHIETTNRCNLNCTMCPHQILKRENKDLEIEIFRKLVDELPFGVVDSVSPYFFGEPLFYKELANCINIIKAKDSSIYTRIRTNAQFLRPEKSYEILSSNLDSLEISVDGWDKASYETIMEGANFEKLISNIKSYLNLKKKLNKKQKNLIVTVIMDETRPHLKSFIRFWSRYMPVEITYRHDAFRPANSSKNGSYIRQTACPEIFYHAIILSNGEVTFCCADVEGELSIGNIKHKPLKELWHSEKAKEIRHMHIKRDFNKLPLCAGCKYGVLRNGIIKR